MSTGALSNRRRRRVWIALALVAVLAALLGLWQPIAGWFAVERGAGTPRPARTGAATPRHRFEPAALEALGAAFEAYEALRAELARDSVAELAPRARAVAAALELAAQSAPRAPREVSARLASAVRAARALEQAAELEPARRAFGELSRELVGLAAIDARLAEGWHVFECPMVGGFAKWFQRSPAIENPYMGGRMPACGGPSSFSAAAEGRAEHRHDASEVAYYTCSMHPSVRADRPGKCPICGMELTAVTHGELASGTIVVDEGRRQRIGVRVAPVAPRPMTLRIRAVGTVKYDEGRLSDVNLRVGGWVQRLFAAETGQRVRAGQPLFTLYSPELYAAQLEYVTALRRGSGAGASDPSPLLRAARQRLLLLGLSAAQVEELGKKDEVPRETPVLSPAQGHVIEKNVVEGARIEAGTRVYRIADLRRVWVDADVYESDLPHVRGGQPAAIELPHVPGRTYAGRIDYVYPTLDGKTRTGRVRIVLDNRELALKPDMYADVAIEVALGERLAVPESAVIYTGPRRLVFVDLGEGRLRPQEVELGARADGYYEVVRGLSAGDVVVTSGNFLIAAESRIRSAARFWGSDGESP